MPVALNTISTAQALATTTTMGDIVWLLNYAETHPDSTLHYCSINMILHVTSYASYLCEECADSSIVGGEDKMFVTILTSWSAKKKWQPSWLCAHSSQR